MSIGRNLEFLTEKTGYTFSNIDYLQESLTHSSYANEMRAKGIVFKSNERLEFLGDSVLETVISKYLYDNYKNSSEGALTKMRQYLVCEKTLAKIAAEIELGEYIHLGKGEELTDCRRRPKVLADSLEALIGAMYLDSLESGCDAYTTIILELFKEEINTASAMQKGDYKTLLQQLVETDGSAILEYEVTEESGPEHNKTFTVVAKVNNNVFGKGTARSKKAAEMEAARTALSVFGIGV